MQSVETRAQAWQRLRSLRADPPKRASSGARRRLFGAALEQSEQLMRGAEQLGAATKPINIFYGLSQGARAIAAALGESNGGRLRGHGITHQGGFDRPIADIRIVDSTEEYGSFTTIAKLRGAPSLPAATRMGDVLAMLPLTSPGQPSWRGQPTSLVMKHLNQSSYVLLVSSPRIYAMTSGWPAVEELRDPDIEVRRGWAQAYLDEHYPSLRGMTPMPDEHPRVLKRGGTFGLTLQLQLDDSLGSDALRTDLLMARARRVGDEFYAAPTVGSDPRPFDSFVAFWAVLWVCSMLARYEPVRWGQLTDVDTSADATALEELLNDALDFIPWFLLDTLDRLPD